MEFFCEKYKEKVDSEQGVCRRPKEYCKFRNACLLYFQSKEKIGAEEEAEDKGGEGK